jgi:hypothetical protein
MSAPVFTARTQLGYRLAGMPEPGRRGTTWCVRPEDGRWGCGGQAPGRLEHLQRLGVQRWRELRVQGGKIITVEGNLERRAILIGVVRCQVVDRGVPEAEQPCAGCSGCERPSRPTQAYADLGDKKEAQRFFAMMAPWTNASVS